MLSRYYGMSSVGVRRNAKNRQPLDVCGGYQKEGSGTRCIACNPMVFGASLEWIVKALDHQELSDSLESCLITES